MAGSNLKEQLIKRYGAKEGMRIYLAIVPGILADFKKVLKEKAPDEIVSETYHFEDGDGAVIVTGSKDSSGKPQITAELSFPGKKLKY